MMATANALLLFATLSYQNRIFRHERFEETLFNLLDNHRKIKNDVQIVVDDEQSVEPYSYTGNEIFLFACADLHDIHSVLKRYSDAQATSTIAVTVIPAVLGKKRKMVMNSAAPAIHTTHMR